jgi:tetratricopeptide (TPR) repeat protein
MRPNAGHALCPVACMRVRPVAGLIAAFLSIVIAHAQTRASELNDAGWKALRDGNPKRASTFFAEGLTLSPDDPVLLLGAGSAAHALGKQPEAMAWLERALELQPRFTAAAALLGRIAYDEGDVDLATRTYERALAYAPGDAAIKRQLDAWRRDADAHHSFSDRRYERFRVMFEGRAEEPLAARATTVLDSAFFRIGEKLGEYPSNTIVAVLYTEQQFRDITRAPAWSGGQYDGRIRIPAAGAAEHPELFDRVLVHELSHAVVAGIAGRPVPAWLDEGLAQYFEGADSAQARQRLTSGGRFIRLRDLERGFGRFGPEAARVAYDESLLAVGVLLDRPGFGWIRLLHRLGNGEPFADAIVNFGFSYEDLEAPFGR